MTETFGSSVSYLKDVIGGISHSKLQDIASTRNLYMALCKVQLCAQTAPSTELAANSNLLVFEELLNSKFIQLNKSMQVVVCSIYEVLLQSSPGYVARAVANSLVTICNGKTSPVGSRDCAITVIGAVMEKRANDLGSLVNDVIAAMTKFFKGSDQSVRISSIETLIKLVAGCGPKIGDCHLELSKLAAKSVSDRSTDIRQKAALLIVEICKNSTGFTSLPVDAVLSSALKGLEDEVAAVQDAYALAVATIYYEQIQAYLEEQEQRQIGLARGGAGDSATDSKKAERRSSITKLKDITIMKDIMNVSTTMIPNKKQADDSNDMKSIIRNIIKTLIKSLPMIRAGYVAALTYLVKLLINNLDKTDFEWLIHILITMLHDSTVMAYTYEEIVTFRSRLTYLFKVGVTACLAETSQMSLAHIFIAFLNSNDSKTEHELQLVLNELSHIITIVGELITPHIEEIKTVAMIHLRHSSFGVRAASAYVLASISTVVPAIAATFLRDSLTGASTQVKQLLVYDDADYDESNSNRDGDGSHEDVDASPRVQSSGSRKSPKDTERMQRMYCFHGHTLVISILLKNERCLPTGLPNQLYIDSFQFGLEMLQLNIQAAPPSGRQIICSIIRAGSLIVSSCLSMGYTKAKGHIQILMNCCNSLLISTSASPTSKDANASAQELLYEVMSIEAALVCISTLLWFCPDALVYDENCLITVVDGLENSFRAIKTKYQPKFRNHFRFRTLHVMLLECFAWLPPGSFPATCQQLFVEALRVFRDSISAGYECTCLNEHMLKEYEILEVAGISKPISYSTPELPLTESMMILRLEYYSIALQKKESEAFQASFNKQIHMPEFNRTPLHASEWIEPSPPCAYIDSRTVDASIGLVAATFGHQTNEYQEKAIQLCSQAIVQYLKNATSNSTTLGIFTSDEDKRKKERKSYITIKNIVTILSAIIRAFPFHNGMSLEMDLQWVQIVAERMLEMLLSTNNEIRCVSSTALGIFCSKIFGTRLIDTISSELIKSIKLLQEKKSDNINDNAGYVLALSSLWLNAKSNPNVQNTIYSTILDMLKRIEYSNYVRAHAVFGLAIILKNQYIDNDINDSRLDVNEVMKLMNKMIHLVEVQLLCGGNTTDNSQPYDNDLLYAALQRLVNVITHITIHIDPMSNLMEENLVKYWSIIRNASTHNLVQLECVEFITISCNYSFNNADLVSICNFLKNIIINPGQYNINFIQETVLCIKSLVPKNSNILCKSGVDTCLFKLLDWCVGSTSTLCSPAYWGIELKSGLELLCANTRPLQIDIEETIESLVAIDIERNPDTKATRWTLLCRALAMSIRTTSDGKKGGEDDEGGAGVETPTAASTNKTDIPSNILQYTTVCRDKSIEHGADINSTRLRIKIVALKSAIIAVVGVMKNPLNSNIHEAKRVIQEQLNNMIMNKTTDFENCINYLSLYVHDIINSACACAAYSIEDYRVIGLQSIAMEFLYVIMYLFWNTYEKSASEFHAVGDEKQDKLLLQFIPQIISAVRPCLTSKWSPNLLWTAGELTFSLIRGNMLTDKVVVKRLVKLVITPVESQDVKYESRYQLSPEVDGSVSVIQHIINTTNIAKLFVLTTSYYTMYSDAVDTSMQETIQAMLIDFLPSLNKVWTAMIIDTARILQGNNNTTKWPKETRISNCHRGGIIYDGNIDPQLIAPYLEISLPYLVSAVALSNQIPNEELSTIFALAVATLDHMKTQTTKTMTSTEFFYSGDIIRSTRYVMEPMVICGLINLCKQCVGSDAISLTQWLPLLAYLTEEFYVSTQHMGSEGGDNRVEDMRCKLLIHFTQALNLHVVAVKAKAAEQEMAAEVEPSSEQHSPSMSSDDSKVVPSPTAANQQQSANDAILNEISLWTWISNLQCVRYIMGPLFAPMENAPNRLSTDLTSQMLLPLQSVFSLSTSVDDRYVAWLNNPTQVQTLLQVLQNISNQANQQPIIVQYIIKLFANVIPYVAIYCKDNALRQRFMSFVSTCLKSLAHGVDGAADINTLLALILNDIQVWQKTSNSPDNFATNAFGPTSSITYDHVTSIILFWLALYFTACEEGCQDEALVTRFDSLALSPDDNGQFFSSAIAAALRYIQQSTNTLRDGQLMSNLIVPTVLLKLSTNTIINEQTELQCIQFVFLICNILNEEKLKSDFIGVILQPLCQYIELKTANHNMSILIGKGITQIARAHPLVFKENVAALTENYRNILMNIMRVVLQGLEQTGGTTTAAAQQQQTAAASISMKKLDMGKFKTAAEANATAAPAPPTQQFVRVTLTRKEDDSPRSRSGSKSSDGGIQQMKSHDSGDGVTPKKGRSNSVQSDNSDGGNNFQFSSSTA